MLVARQCRKPVWWLGKIVARRMNVSHAKVTSWGLSGVSLGDASTILDVGCGGGQTIRTLASGAHGRRVYGVDYSDASVATARRTNAELVATGRVDIQRASVSHLPFQAGMFDVVTAIETHYYWPDLVHDLTEVLRVLKPGGTVAIIAETYRGRTYDWLFAPAMRFVLGATYLTPDAHRDALERAGYTHVVVAVERAKGWIRATGRKPDPLT